jgi:hypothetical protein
VSPANHSPAASVIVVDTATRNSMRELDSSPPPLLDSNRSMRVGRSRFPLSRVAFAVSIGAHVLAGYALSRQVWPSSVPPLSTVAEFAMFEVPRPRPPEPEPAPAPELPQPQAPEQPVTVAPLPPAAEPAPESSAAVEPSDEPQPAAAPVPAPVIDFDEARQRAAEEIVTERSAERQYMTFSIDDVAPPRPVEEPKPERSIFDPGPRSRGPTVGQPGQQRTAFGRTMAGLCNALTGGFSLMGFGSFCAAADEEPSGLFHEVRPAYLDLMPECVETRDTAPQLARESPFPTLKCRLVKQAAAEDQP